MHTSILRLLRHVGLYEIIAFISGFALMAYELAASRILAPTIGSSIYVWTSVIGVIIAALALGYTAGGWLADRRGVAQDVGLLLLAAAIGITMTSVSYGSLLADITLLASDPRAQGVLAATLLFAPASFVLGMISPYLAKLRITSLQTTGRSVAGLSALNSIGGITGTFLTGFVFFNYIGARETIVLLAFVLLACSWTIAPRQLLRKRIIISLAIIVTLSLQIASPAQAGTVASIDTPTSHYKVIEGLYNGRPTHLLIMGPGGYQSGVHTSGSKDLAFEYTQALASVTAATPQKNRILILGGGAFTLPEYLGKQYPEARVDVVEIDAKLPEIARQYFRYEPTANVHVISEDARTYLQKVKTPYDLIIVDVYNDTGVPFSLATREYVDDLKGALTSDGIVAANIIGAANESCLPLLSALNSSYRSEFSQSKLYPLRDVTNLSRQNIIAVYSNAGLDWTKTLQRPAYPFSLPAGQKLTDNFAPTEKLIQQCA